jgi:hypothetical protein
MESEMSHSERIALAAAAAKAGEAIPVFNFNAPASPAKLG